MTEITVIEGVLREHGHLLVRRCMAQNITKPFWHTNFHFRNYKIVNGVRSTLVAVDYRDKYKLLSKEMITHKYHTYER